VKSLFVVKFTCHAMLTKRPVLHSNLLELVIVEIFDEYYCSHLLAFDTP